MERPKFSHYEDANLEIVSHDENDTFKGPVARQVIIHGLDADLKNQSEVGKLKGTIPVELNKSFIRVF